MICHQTKSLLIKEEWRKLFYFFLSITPRTFLCLNPNYDTPVTLIQTSKIQAPTRTKKEFENESSYIIEYLLEEIYESQLSFINNDT